MTKHARNFDEALKKVTNRPRLSRRKSQDTRSYAEDFSHLVRKFPRDAAKSEEVFDFAAKLANNGQRELALEAVEYLFEHESQFATFNKHCGFALSALAQNGNASRVKEILRKAISSYPENIAANQSIGQVFDALISQGYTNDVSKYFFNLCVKEPCLTAQNPETGWVLSHIIDSGKIVEGINAFIVLTTHEPKEVATNKTIDKAISSIHSVDLENIFGKDKAALVNRFIRRIHDIQEKSGLIRG